MAMHQIRSMVAGLQTFWKKYFARNGMLNNEGSYQDEVIEIQDLSRTESNVSSMTEIDTKNTQLHQPNQTIENLKSEMERMQRDIQRRFEHLENKLNENFSTSS